MQSVRLLISLVDDDIVHFLINVRENRKGNQKWTIQKMATDGTQETRRRQTKQKPQYNMIVLDTTMYANKHK